jgi:DNA repair exonuclease SbcCD ATPase subunit
MIEKIAHLGDIHIRKAPLRKEEYENVFKNLIDSLKTEKPDRIVIVGDLVHDYLDLQGEQLILAHELLTELSKIAPVRITRGNHDCRKKNLRRVDSIKAIVKTLNNPEVTYYDKTGFYGDDNIIWAVWHHGEKNNNPWKHKDAKKIIIANLPDSTFIDLFHDPINGCKSTTGFEMKSKQYYKISDFKGTLSMFGDIHKMQYLGKNQTMAYCGSLIAQDVSEGDDAFHGYLLWNVKDKKNISVKEVPIANEWSFKNVKITPYTDFNDLDFEIPDVTKYMKIRFIWGTLPQTRTKENERKLVEYIKSKYNNFTISHENKFLESENIEINENVTLENITETTVQHEIFNEYLERIGTDKQLIEDIIALDEEISADIILDDVSNIEWNIIKFGGKDFMSYHELDIDWRDMDGLFQITGINTAGKTTIMKLISYILFGKTLETETRMKYGDQRFVNNRNDATGCEGYLVLEANGEYYGIKKKTEITRNKAGEINGAPTTIDYYLLTNPDEAMDINTSLDKLDEDRRVKTQQKIETIIGNYDNFMRIVMTTSDTLNRILSNDMAVFIDSLLYDSGLDIFDKKLESLKVYQKKINEKTRVVCDVLKTEEQNGQLTTEIFALEDEIQSIETTTLPEVRNKVQFGRTYIENLSKKLFKIDPEIYNLSVDDTKKSIGIYTTNINDYKAREEVLKASIAILRETYDAERLKLLLEKKEAHKTEEYQKRLSIKSIQQNIRDEEHQIEIINGEIFRLKQDGASKKKEVLALMEGKNAEIPICPTCKQEIVPDHLKHIDENISKIKREMFGIANEIRDKESDIPAHLEIINAKKADVGHISVDIESDALQMEEVLQEIGVLTNEMNDVNKRNIFQTELNQIPTKIQNEELHIELLQQKIDNYDNSLLQIEENHKIEKVVDTAKLRLETLEEEEEDSKENIYLKKTAIGEKSAKIAANNKLITAFKEQEYRDSVVSLYKKCVHRDGIPTQILSNYILPKINVTLENILSVALFKVWLDLDDLRPKLVYNNRPTAIIDCISASGKERTFASVVLKFALNQINVKAKPMMFLLDEIMGKFDLEGSVEEFINILQLIKNHMKKVLIIEQIHEINPDYLISVQLDENGISTMILE